MQTLSKYLVKKHAALLAEQVRLVTEYNEIKRELSAVYLKYDMNRADMRISQEWQDVKARSDANYAARMANDNSLSAFIEKHTKAPKLPEHLKRDFVLTLQYPRDGMGKLKLSSNNAPLVWAGGCGYDKRGKVIGDWMNATFGELFNAELNALHVERFYGMTQYNDAPIKLDGACGENCMIDILNWLGYSVTYTLDAKKQYITAYSVAYKGA